MSNILIANFKPSPGIVDGAKPGPRPFKWMIRVREKFWHRKEFTYWVNGPQKSAQEVGDHVTIHYPNVDVLSVELANRVPEKILTPIPAEHFESKAINDALIEEFGYKPTLRELIEPIRAAPIRSTIKPIERRRSLLLK